MNTIAGTVQAADKPPTKLMGPIAEKRMSQRVIHMGWADAARCMF